VAHLCEKHVVSLFQHQLEEGLVDAVRFGSPDMPQYIIRDPVEVKPEGPGAGQPGRNNGVAGLELDLHGQDASLPQLALLVVVVVVGPYEAPLKVLELVVQVLLVQSQLLAPAAHAMQGPGPCMAGDLLEHPAAPGVREDDCGRMFDQGLNHPHALDRPDLVLQAGRASHDLYQFPHRFLPEVLVAAHRLAQALLEQHREGHSVQGRDVEGAIVPGRQPVVDEHRLEAVVHAQPEGEDAVLGQVAGCLEHPPQQLLLYGQQEIDSPHQILALGEMRPDQGVADGSKGEHLGQRRAEPEIGQPYGLAFLLLPPQGGLERLVVELPGDLPDQLGKLLAGGVLLGVEEEQGEYVCPLDVPLLALGQDLLLVELCPDLGAVLHELLLDDRLGLDLHGQLLEQVELVDEGGLLLQDRAAGGQLPGLLPVLLALLQLALQEGHDVVAPAFLPGLQVPPGQLLCRLPDAAAH
jgi:hypothetical protein